MIHNVNNIPLSPQFEHTLVTGTLLIYYKDAIKSMQFVSVLLWVLSRSRALSDFSLQKLTSQHVH